MRCLFPSSHLDMMQSQAAYLRVLSAVHEPCGRWLTPACFSHPEQFLHCCAEMIDLHKTNVSTHDIVLLCEQRPCPFSVQGSNERDSSRESGFGGGQNNLLDEINIMNPGAFSIPTFQDSGDPPWFLLKECIHFLEYK